MRNHLLIAITFATACVTAGSSAPDADPLAMFAGTTGTVPATSTSVVNYCTFPILEVASGVDITVSWENLDETIEGTPIDYTTISFSTSTTEFPTIEAADEACVDLSVDINSRHVDHSDDSPLGAVVPADHFTDGGATIFRLSFPDQATRTIKSAQLRLEPASTSGVTFVELTADAWVN